MKKVISLVMVLLFMLSVSVFPVHAANEIKILLDEQYLEMDVNPVIIDGRTLVPARAVVERLGGKVDWSGEKSLVTVTKGDTTVLLTVDDSTAIVNGSPVTLDVPAQIVDSRTMIPLRFVAESLGVKVDFYKNTVIILSDMNADSLKSMGMIDGKDTDLAQPTPAQISAPAQANETTGQKNAVSKAKSYLKSSSFSYQGLINQLEYSKFTKEEATYGADNCGADWKEQAVSKAKSYITSSSFSYQGLIDQLEYSKFTKEEATYGADNCGADWKEQAVSKAKSYLKSSSFSYQGLIDQLEYSKFTKEEAKYGADNCGANWN